eukprot:1946982-Prymnesium_polylepis.1
MGSWRGWRCCIATAAPSSTPRASSARTRTVSTRTRTRRPGRAPASLCAAMAHSPNTRRVWTAVQPSPPIDVCNRAPSSDDRRRGRIIAFRCAASGPFRRTMCLATRSMMSASSPSRAFSSRARSRTMSWASRRSCTRRCSRR